MQLTPSIWPYYVIVHQYFLLYHMDLLNVYQSVHSVIHIPSFNDILNLFIFSDVDECAAGVANCLPGQICFNTHGAFECRVDCQDGFRYDST